MFNVEKIAQVLVSIAVVTGAIAPEAKAQYSHYGAVMEAIVTNEDVNCRLAPNLSATVTETLNKEQHILVQLIDESSDWLRAVGGCYVHRSLVVIPSNWAEPVVRNGVQSIGVVVINDDVNCRLAPGLDGEVVTQVNTGQSLDVFQSEQAGWFKIATGIGCYVHSSQVLPR
jgi:uncharacterized protein YgiM (DUF1202 family)